MEIVTIIHEGLLLATNPQNFFITLTPNSKRGGLNVDSVHEGHAIQYIASTMGIDENRIIITDIEGDDSGNVILYITVSDLVGWHYLISGEIG
jgi:hypothetical protein